MIRRLREVIPNQLYRGSAPTPNDVLWLKDNLKINKIVSLDEKSGEQISRACQILKIKQIKIYIDQTRSSLLNFLKYNLKDLFLSDGPIFVHCKEGKDRTGLAIALLKCKFFGEDPQSALQEAKSLGFGINVDPNFIALYEKLILSCKPISDENSADIVSNVRSYKSDNRDSFLDEAHQGSFSPYLSKSRQYPIDFVHNPINNQSPTREQVLSKDNFQSIIEYQEKPDQKDLPLVGIFNNDAGIRGAGPMEPVGGFIHD